MKRSMLLFCGSSLIVALVAGCSGPQVRSFSPEDNPEHHYLAGMTSVENGKITAAAEKFQRAVYLDDQFAKAYAGLALVSAERVKSQSDVEFRAVEAERALSFLEKAGKLAEKPEEQFDQRVAVIRTHTAVKDKKWLEEAESAYQAGLQLKVDERALTYYQGAEALAYFMGAAYLEGHQFQKARDRFSEVLNARAEGKWHEKADKGWKKSDRIVRAMVGITVGDVGKAIAVKDAVSRGDLTALLMDELKLDKLFGGKIPTASQKSKEAEFTPADIHSHPFKDEILTAMKWKVRGLEPKYDESSKAYLFKPAENVARGEMALILEDILMKLTGDDKLSSGFFGHEKSPFPDVRPTSPLYNAIMNVTTRGIMEGELSGEFRPSDPVDGADALLAVRMLRQKINIY